MRPVPGRRVRQPLDMTFDGATVPPFGTLSLCSTMDERPPLVFGDGSVVFQGNLSGGCAAPPCRAILVDVAPGSVPPPIVLVIEDDAITGGTVENPHECRNESRRRAVGPDAG